MRFAEPDRETLELPAAAVEAVLSERTRWVAVTAASNAVGTVPDLAGIVAAAHARRRARLRRRRARHAAPPARRAALGCDALACSAYKWFGPHIGVLWARPELLAELAADKLAPSPDTVPERWETGTLPFESLVGVTRPPTTCAASDWDAVRAHEQALLAQTVEGLGAIPGVTLHGAARQRAPTLMFTVEGRTPREVAARLAARRGRGVGRQLLRVGALALLGLEPDGAVRAGVVHYNDEDGRAPARRRPRALAARACEQEEHRDPPAARELGLVSCEALGRGAALAQRGQRQARVLQRGDVSLDRAVVPDHASAEPVQLARPAGEVVVDDPVRTQLLGARPRVVRGDDRVDDGEHDAAAS